MPFEGSTTMGGGSELTPHLRATVGYLADPTIQ